MYTIQGIDKDRPAQEFESVSDALSFHRVLSIEKTETGVTFTEGCDEVFDVTLTIEQIRAFAEELIALCES